MKLLFRISIFVIIGVLLLISTLSAQQMCSATDTLRTVRQGGGFWYLVNETGTDSLRHLNGNSRGFGSSDNATAMAIFLQKTTGNKWNISNTSTIRIVGCISSEVDTILASTPPDTVVITMPPDTVFVNVPPDTVVITMPPDTVFVTPVVEDTTSSPVALGFITCHPESACTGDASPSMGDSTQWYSESSPGIGILLTDRGSLWSAAKIGFGDSTNPTAPRTRIWWIVSWLGSKADTSKIIWTVPVTEPTVWAAEPLRTNIGAGLPMQRWITEHLTDGGAVYHWMPSGGSSLVFRCGGVWLGAAWAQAESTKVGRVDRKALLEGMRICRGTIS